MPAPPSAPAPLDGLQALVREQDTLLEAAPLGVLVVSDHKPVWVNRKMEELCGFTAAELLNRSVRTFFLSDEMYEKLASDSRTGTRE